jgi:predicted transcriptional regulator
MAKSTKVTFTLDDATIIRLNDAAQRLAIPKSEVVREAIQDYHARIGRLSEAERRRMLADFDRLVPLIPDRPLAEVKRELDEIRAARRRGSQKSREEHRL